MKIGALVVSIALLSVTQSGFSATGGSFKRFSVSAGVVTCYASRKGQSI